MPDTPLLRRIGGLARSCALAVPVGILAGCASALFLWSLDLVTKTRLQHDWLIWLLPLAGLLMGWFYSTLGRPTERGNNLILDQVQQPDGKVPRRMAPSILLSTLLTHLFGGSAGREGTAIQMGGGLAAWLGRLLGVTKDELRLLLMAGMAAGFGSVFGTPVAGAVFALEVQVVGRMHYRALLPMLVASLTGHLVCLAWGIHHTGYLVTEATAGMNHEGLNLPLLAKALAAALAFGLVARLFSESLHRLGQVAKNLVPSPLLRPALAGLLLLGLALLLGTRDYLGIGTIPANEHSITLSSCFNSGGADTWSWFWKLLFTVITLSCGFKGGEVTPLFFIGAALGNTLALFLGAPVDLFAAMGFIAVFGAASNTPIACTLMGMELFGGHHALYFALACFVAYHASGHRGIYSAQRVNDPKF